MAVELFPTPLYLATDQFKSLEDDNTKEKIETVHVLAADARSWVKDLDALATLRSPNIRTFLGIAIGPLDVHANCAAATYVYEAAKRHKVLFEWIHACMSDGSQQPIGFKNELRIC